jgi:hypothetical protein
MRDWTNRQKSTMAQLEQQLTTGTAVLQVDRVSIHLKIKNQIGRIRTTGTLSTTTQISFQHHHRKSYGECTLTGVEEEARGGSS